jgi:type IV secretory pathway VirB10-like protein
MDRENMKRSLRIIVAVAVFTSVIAGALTLSTLMLLQSKSAKPMSGAPPKGLVSAGPKNSPEMVGTERPVPVNPTPAETAAPKRKAPNPVKTAPPQSPNLVENDSEQGAETPQEFVREKAEEERQNAERMRARVEELYQRRQISGEAYRKGQAEYQEELAKYEHQIAKYHNATTGTGAANE